jgi:NitT/TauT family transport system permease protein
MAKVANRSIALSSSVTALAPDDGARVVRVMRLKAALSASSLQLLSVVIFLATWWAVSILPTAIHIPSPMEALQSALQLDPVEFLNDLLLSLRRVILGFVIAAVIAIPLGVACGYSQLVRDAVFPSIELFRPIPPIAWIPLAILFFPQVEWMIIFLTFYGAFFPIVYNTISGVAGIKASYIRAAKSLGASEWTVFRQVMLPAALPTIFAGLHIAISVAWLMVVAGEMIANKGGIGAMTWQAYQTTQYPRIFVGMAAIGVLGYLSSVLVRLAAQLTIRWEQ